jgi:hypothetical protein
MFFYRIARLTALSALLSAVLAAASFAYFGDVIASFPAPAEGPQALAYADGSLYCYCDSQAGRIWRINAANGNVTGSFVFDKAGAYLGGLTHDGDYLWAGNTEENRIYRFDWGGSVLSSFQAGWNVGNGLAWSGWHIWGSAEGKKWAYRFYQMRFTGTVIRSYQTYYESYDVAWDGRYLWIPQYDDIATAYLVVAMTPTDGSVEGMLENLPGDQPRGSTCEGSYIWLSTLADGGYLWKIDITGLAVEPTSMGKVKALFR